MRIPIIIISTILIAVSSSMGQTALKTIRIINPNDTLTSGQDLNPEWLKLDEENLINICSLVSATHTLKDKGQFIHSIIKLDIRDTKDLGFGLTYFDCAQYGGYVTTWISLLSFENKIIQYDIRYTEDDFRIINYLIRQDKKLKNEISFVVDSLEPFSFDYKDKVAFAKFEAGVAKTLGTIELLTETSDENFILNYSILADPINNYYFGTHCYESGIEPTGRVAIKYFISSNNISAIREIIKGYNPEGRLYAIEALLVAASQKKTTLTNKDKKIIRDVLSLNIPINRCSGCIVSKSTANELLDEELKAILAN